MSLEIILGAGFPAASAAFAAGWLSGLSQRRRLRAQRDQFQRLAVTDSLTGLANRAGLMADLDSRQAAGESYALALVDLDRFAPVNNQYGHDVGDALLIEVADRLAGILAGADDGLVARLGGDEFVLVGSSAAPATSLLLGYDVVRALAKPVNVGGPVGELVVHASVGVLHAWPGDEPARLLRAADIAMYEAKTAGGDAVVEHDPAAGLPEVEDRPLVRLRDLVAFGRGLSEVPA
jgi:diguanylate cyclase